MTVVSNGTNLIDNGALDAAVPSGSLILLSTQTASASASISFTSGIDSTYDSYMFKFINIHPGTDWNNWFAFQVSINGGTSYGISATTSTYRAYHNEADSQTGLGYLDPPDYSQTSSTQFIRLCEDTSSANADDNLSGVLQIYNMASTTQKKHFLASSNSNTTKVGQNYCLNWYGGGYFDTTSDLDAIQFKMNSGNIDAGIIKMYGVK